MSQVGSMSYDRQIMNVSEFWGQDRDQWPMRRLQPSSTLILDRADNVLRIDNLPILSSDDR
jgi:hypothetical protein